VRANRSPTEITFEAKKKIIDIVIYSFLAAGFFLVMQEKSLGPKKILRQEKSYVLSLYQRKINMFVQILRWSRVNDKAQAPVK